MAWRDAHGSALRFTPWLAVSMTAALLAGCARGSPISPPASRSDRRSRPASGAGVAFLGHRRTLTSIAWARRWGPTVRKQGGDPR
jgi:hypothetical protein